MGKQHTTQGLRASAAAAALKAFVSSNASLWNGAIRSAVLFEQSATTASAADTLDAGEAAVNSRVVKTSNPYATRHH